MTRTRETPADRKSWLLLLALATGVFLSLAILSFARYRAYTYLNFDMARIRQALWNTMHGDPLLVTTKGMPLSRLSEHVEIVFLLISPAYYLFRSAAFLIVLQAALFGLGAIPVYRLARRRLHSSRVALVFAALYLFYPVAQTAVLSEIHGDTLAMPLLLFALEAGACRAWRAYTVWTALALACKVYVAIPVAAMGIVYFLSGERRAGLLTFLGAILWGAFAFLVVRDLFAPPEAATLAKADAAGYLDFYFGQIRQIASTWQLRLTHGMIATLPAVLLGLRAPQWLIAAGTIVGPVLISTGPGPVYSSQFHHYTLAVPFLLMAMIAGATRLKRVQQGVHSEPSRTIPWKRAVKITFAITILLNVLTVDNPLSPWFYLAPEGSGRGLSRMGYLSEDRDRLKDAWLARVVGPNERVAGDELLGQRLVNRQVLVSTNAEFASLEDALKPVDIVVVDALYDFSLGNEEIILDGGVTTEHDTIALLLSDGGWTLQKGRDGLVMFSRSRQGLEQAVSVFGMEQEPPLIERFDGLIGLVYADVSHVSGSRWRLTYEWTPLQELGGYAPLMAVTRIEGVPFSRIAHLPTIGLQPTTTWQRNTTIRETFEFDVPEGTAPGKYRLYVSWYRTDSIHSSQTDKRTRVGSEVMVGVLEVEDS